MTLRFRRNRSTATTSQRAATHPYLRKAQIPNHGTDDVGEHAIYTLGPVIGPPNRSRPGPIKATGGSGSLPTCSLLPDTERRTPADKARQAARHERY